MTKEYSANIQFIDTTGKTCGINIFHGDYVVVANNVLSNLELNQDGTANTQWVRSQITQYIKLYDQKIKLETKPIFVNRIGRINR
ncbi:MAG TPA: hypothetical protein EYN69_07535 [Flavobacteriales bacterium]|jgi:hypothetical protein|nr:hypothetical protein [Flavobacteriales bacterium]